MLLQVAVIITMIIVKLLVLADGRDILIRIQPVDPRDLLRGDYVTYQHDFTNIPGYYFDNDEVFRVGELAYVTLQESSGFAHPSRLTHKKPSEGLFIQGRVLSDTARVSGARPDYRLSYGIEQYYIPEGKGAMFNTWTRDRNAFAKVAVDSDGKAVLKQLYIDDKPWP